MTGLDISRTMVEIAHTTGLTEEDVLEALVAMLEKRPPGEGGCPRIGFEVGLHPFVLGAGILHRAQLRGRRGCRWLRIGERELRAKRMRVRHG